MTLNTLKYRITCCPFISVIFWLEICPNLLDEILSEKPCGRNGVRKIGPWSSSSHSP
jgi:hypothetical protein